MGFRQIWLPLLLILCVAPASTTMTSVMPSGTYATITSQTTETTSYPSPATVGYVTSTRTSYVYGPTDFTLNICGQGARLNVTFNANRGQKFHVDWKATAQPSATYSLNFYITPEFLSVGQNLIGCDTFPSDEALYSHSGSTASVDWIAPSTGRFNAWLWNLNPKPVTGTISIERNTPIIVTSISYTTVPSTRVLNLTTVIFEPSLNASFSIPLGWTTPLIGIGAGAIVCISIGITLHARTARRASKSTATRVYDVGETAVGIFCVNCGGSLPAGSSYCRRCGTKQPERESGWE